MSSPTSTDPLQGLPAHAGLERLILGAILLDAEHFLAAHAVLSADDFSIEKHQRIWTAMATLWERGESIDRITVANELKRLGLLEACGGLTYLVTLDDDLPPIYHVEDYIRTIQEKAILRRCIFASQALIDRCMLPGAAPQSVIQEAESVLRKLEESATRRTEGLLHMEEVIKNHPGGLDGLVFPPQDQQGIPMPLPIMQKLTGGLKQKELIIIGARPAHGKTALGTQIIDHAGSLGYRCALFTFEMSRAEIVLRMLCCRARVDSERLSAGQCSKEEVWRLQQAAADLAAMPIYIDDGAGATVASVHAACRKQMAATGLDLVVVDYLQLLEGQGRTGEGRTAELSQITRRLKLMATEFNIPVVVLSQLNRDSDREKRRPELRDLRESGSIEQDANKVIFPWRPPPSANSPALPTSEFIVAKNRNGPTGRALIGFIPQFTRFVSLLDDERGGDLEAGQPWDPGLL